MAILSTVFLSLGVSGAKSITNQQQAMLEILNVTDKIISDEDIKSINFWFRIRIKILQLNGMAE